MTLLKPKFLYPLLLTVCLADFASRFFPEMQQINRAGSESLTPFSVRQDIGDTAALRKLYQSALDNDGSTVATGSDAGKFDSFTANGLTVALVAIYEAEQRIAVLSVKTERQQPVMQRLQLNAELSGYKLVELNRQQIVLQNAQHSKVLKLFTPQKSNKDQ